MYEESYESIENWASRIMPQVISCPREIVLDKLQATCVDFFKETEVWVYECQEELAANTKTLELTIPDESEIVYIESVRINRVGCCAGDFVVDYKSHTITFHNMANVSSEVCVEVILRTKRYCTKIPSRLLEEYGDTIGHGALFRLKSMTGEKETIPWSDPEAAKFFYELYKDEVNKAKLRAKVKRAYGQVKPAWA